MKTLETLSPADREAADKLVDELHARGYADRESFNELRPGVRIRHRGHQYPSAYREGTGVVVAITERNPSSWSQVYDVPDIEMAVAWDQPLGLSVSAVAQYHVQVVSPASAPNPGDAR